MKKTTILLALLMMTYSALAQKLNEADVPQTIKSVFSTRITDSVKVSWEKSGTSYLASFTKNNLPAYVEIRETGEWIKTAWGIPTEYVPGRIKTHMEENYPGFKIKDAHIEYRIDGEFYNITGRKKKEEMIFLYSIKTDFVKAEKKPAAKKK